MTTMTIAPNTWRKTKTGEWVVMGDWTSLQNKVGCTVKVTSAKGEVKEVQIARLGKPFLASGVYKVYAYPVADRIHTATRATGRRGCITGGNCSSFGNGRSCGGHDCDGH